MSEGKLPKALVYNVEKSALLVVGSNGGGTILEHNCDRDAELISDAMKKTGFVKESLLITSSLDRDDCSKEGLKRAIDKEMSKVPNGDDNGLFIFIYCGKSCDLWDHGLCLNVNKYGDSDGNSYVVVDPDASKSRFLLDLNDFKPEDPNTHISGGTLSKMIADSQAKPQQIIVILDCPHAEEISSGIKKCLSNCELTVLVSQAKNEKYHYFKTLECSTFTYFFTTILSKTNFTPGMISLQGLLARVTKCCNALSNLRVYKEGLRLKSGTSTPKASFTKILKEANSLMDRLGADDGDEVDSGDEVDGGGTLSNFLYRYYPKRSSKLIKLRKEATDWVHAVMEGPLVVLKEEDVLDEKVVHSIIVSMVFSLATIQQELEKGSIAGTNIFIEAYVHVAAAINMIDQSIDVWSIPLLNLAQEIYLEVLKNKNVSEKEMKKLIERMESDGQK